MLQDKRLIGTSTKCLALSLALLAVQATYAEDRFWVGRFESAGAGSADVRHASFIDGGSWYGFIAPTATDAAVFGWGSLPSSAGPIPIKSSIVHFGGVRRSVTGGFINEAPFTGSVNKVVVEDGDFSFDFAPYSEDLGQAATGFGTLTATDRWDNLVVGTTKRGKIWQGSPDVSPSPGNAKLSLLNGTYNGQFKIGAGTGNAGFIDIAAGATIDATAAQYDISFVGDWGSGRLDVRGQVNGQAMWIGSGDTGEGRVNVDGGSILLTGGVGIGQNHFGQVHVLNGAVFQAREILIGGQYGVHGGYGELLVNDSRVVASDFINVGQDATGFAALRNSTLETGWLGVGSWDYSSGRLEAWQGSSLSARTMQIAWRENTVGSVLIDSSTVTVRDEVKLAENDGEASLTLQNGSDLSANNLTTGFANVFNNEPYTGRSTILVDNSTVNFTKADGFSRFWISGDSSVTIKNGATVDNVSSFTLGVGRGDYVTGLITGGSTVNTGWVRAGGGDGTGILTIEDGSTLKAAAGWVGGTNPDSHGTFIVRNNGRLDMSTPDAEWGQRSSLSVLTDDLLDVSQGGYARIGSDTWKQNTVVVGAKGFLGGTGKVKGNVIVEEGGILSPGNSPGTLHLDGDVLFDGGTLEMEVASTATGLEHDLLDVTGEVKLGGVLNLKFSGTLTTDRLTLISGRSVLGSFDQVILPSGFSYFAGGNEVWVQTQAVPEPATMLALGTGVLALLRRRKR